MLFCRKCLVGSPLRSNFINTTQFSFISCSKFAAVVKCKGYYARILLPPRPRAIQVSSEANIVNKIVVTMYGAKWVLEISWGSLVKVNDCVNSMLYT